MTMIHEFEKKCSVCGETSMHPVLMSTNSWGAPDLDLRPAPMQRDTMDTWLDECPHCGYVAPDLENETAISAQFLETEEYLTCEGNDFKNNLSKRFFRCYLISKSLNEPRSEFYALLHCAWTCDDADDELAVKIRKMSLDAFEKFETDDENEKKNLQILKADLLRRSLQFERLIDEYENFTIDDELLYSIIRFQLEHAIKKDGACYTVEDVVKEFNLKL